MEGFKLYDLMYGNEEGLREMLFKFKDFMDEQGIEFVLLYGALLGACRNNRLLPWDIDIDVHIPFKSYEDFVEVDIFGLMRNAYKKGFVSVNLASGSKVEFRADTEYFDNANIGLLPEKEQWKEYLSGVVLPHGVDKFTLYWKYSGITDYLVENMDGYVHIDCIPVVKGIHSEYMYNEDDSGSILLENVVLYGEEFNAPYGYLQHLSDYYGENWKEVFCSFDLWMKYKESLRKGIVPQEVTDFMNKWRPLLKDWCGLV